MTAHKNVGKSLEKLVRVLERVLSPKETVVIESPKYLIDRITNKKREHDVVLTIKQGHHELIVAIECRDRKRPVTVNEIESFWKKCQDTGVAQGIVVSPKGFSDQAKEKADKLAIRCLKLSEVEEFPWLSSASMTFLTRSLKHTNWTFNIKDAMKRRVNEDFEIVDSYGTVITPQILTENLRSVMYDKSLSGDVNEKIQNVIKFPGEGLYLRYKSSPELIPVENVIAISEWEISKEVSPFKLFTYEDSKKGKIVNGAIAESKLNGIPGDIFIVEKETGEKEILLALKKK